jgi:hypothetical protein
MMNFGAGFGITGAGNKVFFKTRFEWSFGKAPAGGK